MQGTRLVALTTAGLAVAITTALLASPPQGANPVYPVGPPWSRPDPQLQPRDLSRELNNKMSGTFTVASAGDLFWRLPVAARISPELKAILRNANTTIGNLEGGLGFSPQERAQDMAALGFDLLAPGEVEGPIDTTLQYMNEVGVKVAGAGLTVAAARRPAFHETPQGRVALLSACPGIALCGAPAGGRGGNGSGANPLGVTVWNTVTQEQFNQLRGIVDSIMARRNEADVVSPSDLPPDFGPGRIVFFGQRFLVAAKPGEIRYELNAADEEAQVVNLRNTKELSDFVAFHMHVHHNRYTFQRYSYDNYPPDYLRPFLHKLIDNGMDMYVGTGNHTMQGIEIYKGRPIFYNQGNLGVDVVRSQGSTGNQTGTEGGATRFSMYMTEEASYAYIANTTYNDGRLVEVRIYPVDIGLTGERSWSREQIPQTPSPQKARVILEKIQKYSEPFGTKISIENNIGIIRVSPEATVPVSGTVAPAGPGGARGGAGGRGGRGAIGGR